jgi:hypothetical protein
MVTSPAGVGPENDCAGEGQQQVRTTNPFFGQWGCYVRTMRASIQLRKNVGRESQRTDPLITIRSSFVLIQL